MKTSIHKQEGVSLIIALLIATLLLAAVLAVATIIVRQRALLLNTENSISSFYAADSGIEKTLHFDRKQIPNGATRGLCNICVVCTDCNECTLTPLAPAGCNVNTCNNCHLTYNSEFDNRTFFIDATLQGQHLLIRAKGLFQNTLRTSTFDSANP